MQDNFNTSISTGLSIADKKIQCMEYLTNSIISNCIGGRLEEGN